MAVRVEEDSKITEEESKSQNKCWMTENKKGKEGEKNRWRN